MSLFDTSTDFDGPISALPSHRLKAAHLRGLASQSQYGVFIEYDPATAPADPPGIEAFAVADHATGETYCYEFDADTTEWSERVAGPEFDTGSLHRLE